MERKYSNFRSIKASTGMLYSVLASKSINGLEWKVPKGCTNNHWSRKHDIQGNKKTLGSLSLGKRCQSK